MAPIEQNIAKQAYRAGAPIPDRILNAPVLREGLQIYLQAFFDLDTERNHGMGLMYIPWSKIKNYAEFYNFSFEETQDLLFIY